MARLSIPKPLKQWMYNPRTRLGHYRHTVERLTQLNQYWKAQQDRSVVMHSMIANVTHDTLVIAVESSGWASYLHYDKLELLQRFKRAFRLHQLAYIKWYVQPPVTTLVAPKPLVHKIAISKSNQTLIQSMANTIAHDGLRLALLQLGKE